MLLLLIACTGDGGKDSVDASAPTLSHTPPSAASAGQPLTITVDAEDPQGVGSVTMYYRDQGARSYHSLALVSDDGSTWTADVPGEDVSTPGIEYYFRGEDLSAEPAVGWLPADFDANPFAVDVTVDGSAFPFYEDFETTSLQAKGWANAGEGFMGYDWQASENQAHEGVSSAWHPRSIDGLDPIDDYLISPAIDLSTVSEAQAVWYEYGSTVVRADHGLYISTGSRDPADGEYVAVVESLDAPTDGAWGRSAIVDISAWAGNPRVYLAWRYQGVDADDWYIDDVYVAEPTADLSASWSVSPEVLHPGESGTLTVDITNGTNEAATDAVVTVTFPSGGASVAEGSQSAGPIGGGGSASVDFSLSIDAATIDNSRVPIHLEIADGDLVSAFDGQLTVGYASTASITWLAGSPGQLNATIGVGDPDAPTWTGTVWSGPVVAGENTFTYDLTDQYAYLPPAAGDHRWWVKLDVDNGGEVTDFHISYANVDYAATVLPAVLQNDDGIVYVPEPATLSLTRVTTTPSTLAPGTTGASLSVNVYNAGSPTSGPVTATLTSTDPDLLILDPGPVDVTTSAMGEGATVSLSNIFSFDVADTHTDNGDLDAEIVLTDGVETWTEAIQLAVPWPVFRITNLEIDDDGGDGVLNPDESAELTFTITNVGDQSSTGSVYGVLDGTTTGTGSLLFSTDAQRFGTITSGDSQDQDGFTVDVAGGAEGDPIDLVLTLTDDAHTYLATTTLNLGEPPWISMSAQDDAVGDSLSGEFDMVRGWYRSYNDELQLRIEFNEPYDASKLFVEFWGLSTGGDYDYYNGVYNYGTAYLRGYSSSMGDFDSLLDPVAVQVSDTILELDLSIPAMGLSLDSMELGFGSGTCPSDDYFYCDHMPDNWGYPYSAWSPSLWYSLEW